MTQRSLQGEEPNPERTIQSSVKAIVTANHTSDRICIIQMWGTFETRHRCEKLFFFFYVTWIYTHGQQWDHHQNSLQPEKLFKWTENTHGPQLHTSSSVNTVRVLGHVPLLHMWATSRPEGLSHFLNIMKICFSISSWPLRLPEVMVTIPTHSSPGVNTGLTSCNRHLLQSNCVLCKDKNLNRNLKARMILQMSPVIVYHFFMVLFLKVMVRTSGH